MLKTRTITMREFDISIKSLYIKCVRESKINKSQGKKKEKGIKYKLDIPLSLKIKTLRPTIFL